MSETPIPPAACDAAAPRRLDRRDARTLVLSALGGALEFYDFVVFVFLALPLGELFFPHDTAPWLAQIKVYGIFAAGYLARPLGGIVMAHFGDRAGRKRMFALSVFLMAVPTLAIGLLPTYAHIGVWAPLLLLLLRIVQGIAVGGEVPGAWVFVAEHAPRGRVGFACGSLTAGLTAGILIGSLLTAWLNAHLDNAQLLDWGWRVPFLLGGVFGLIAVWLRRWLAETPVFVQMREARELSREMPLRVVLATQRRSVALSMAVTWMLTAAVVVLILLLPTLAPASFGTPARLAAQANVLAACGLTIGCMLFGSLADRFGAAATLLGGSLLLIAATWVLFADLAAGGAHFTVLYALAGVAVGVVGVVPVVMVEAFPPAVRFSGLSFSYNVAYAVFGAGTAAMIGWLAMHAGRMAPAHYVTITAVVSVFVSGWLLKTPTPALRTDSRSSAPPA